jgi:hypothetical protein
LPSKPRRIGVELIALVDRALEEISDAQSAHVSGVTDVTCDQRRKGLLDERHGRPGHASVAGGTKKKLLQLASWLDSNGHTDAAAGLREGLDETLTVMRLGLMGTLRRTFATTNPIENMNGSLRRVSRNVKRWKDEAMIRRCVALGIVEAQKGFRRVKGYVHMPSLAAALRPGAAIVASVKKVA